MIKYKYTEREEDFYMTVTVTDLQKTGKLDFSRGRYNIIDCGARTGKTYWAINHLKDWTRDGHLNRVLFLVDTTMLKDSLLLNYEDQCCDADVMWRRVGSQWDSEDNNRIGVMCYQALGSAVIREEVDFLDNIDVICWDECDSVFDFAAAAFAKARKTDFSRQTISNEEVLAIIQQYSTKREYMPLVLLGFWEQLINKGRVLCVGLSATPERAKMYYDSLVHESNKGKVQTTYRAAADIYFKNIMDHIKELHPIPGMGYWCYSPSIEHNRAIVRAAEAQGFRAIELHSSNNDDKPLTDEQKRVISFINATHYVPLEYDFVAVNAAQKRGIDIDDPRFNQLIVDSYLREDRLQAGRQTFPFQRHVKVLVEAVPEDFLNRWLTADECKELAALMAVPDINIEEGKKHTQTRLMSWNKLKDVLPSFGYTIAHARKRINGEKNARQVYQIQGQWHDAELIADNNFMSLVAAKTNIEDIETLVNPG